MQNLMFTSKYPFAILFILELRGKRGIILIFIHNFSGLHFFILLLLFFSVNVLVQEF